MPTRITSEQHAGDRGHDDRNETRAKLLRRVWDALGTKAYLFSVALLVVLIGYVLSPYFLTSRNLVAVLITASVVSILAVGQFMVIVTGGIDLSVGSVAALSSVVSALALQNGMPMPVAVLIGLAVGGGIGLFNGLLIVYGGITPFIVTLAMLSIARGLAYLIQTGRFVPIDNAAFMSVFNGEVAGVPSPVLIALVVTAVAAVVLAFMPFGRRLYAIGSNPEAARLSGLPVRRDVLRAYFLSSTLAGLGGMMIAAQLTEGSAIIGNEYELNSIAAVVVGGASLFGGSGDPISAVVGGLIIAMILNIMDLVGVQAQTQLIVKGAVIVLAVLFTTGRGREGVRRLWTLVRRRQPRSGRAQGGDEA
ncbi:MAG: putative D-ribose transporter permease protein [Aeromicrobium sp.]|nr:putative D-ribose transporter permease protein [Aeromicrobium sp.]